MKRNIVVADDYYERPDIVRDEALEMAFEPGRGSAGRRTISMDVPPYTADDLSSLIGRKFSKGYMLYQYCIGGDQLVYHSDNQDYAAVVFLTPDAPASTGTSFYRSKETQVRSSEELGTAEVEKLTYNNKLLDRTAWEEIDRIGNVFNRIVVWNSRLIHAASDYFGHDKESGRLFQMIFFDAEG